MKIGAAFPDILERKYASVKPGYPLLTVLYLLRMQEVDAVPLAYADNSNPKAVFGFSSLPKLMALGPKRFGALLKGPCEDAADDLASLGVDDDLASLLDAYESKRLGFAIVRGVGGEKNRRSMVSLTDILGLYLKRALKTKMVVNDVATPMFSMPASTSIRSALQAMFRHRFRRVFISERDYISDRSILGYLFSPLTLEQLEQERGNDILSAPIDKLEKMSAISVSPGTNLRTAALKLRVDRGECLVLSGGRVATPWDVVMKPWSAKKLAID